MKKRNKRIVVSLGVLMVLVTTTIVVMVHRRVWNIQEALEQLVTSKTHGQYKLVIKDYSLEWNPLMISFDSLRMIRHDSVHANVKQVIVPRLVLVTGSVFDFVRGDQLEVRSLTVDEPIIELEPQAKHRPQGIQFSQQIVKLYPAVEVLLERFNVVHFEIKRASIDIRKQNRSELQLNLIDLLVENWNVKSLQADRQLRLAMGSQEVNLSKGSFAFSALEYDFRKRELRFSDYRYSSEDMLTHSTFKTTGAYIAFNRLDYTELFQHQRLIYEKLTFERPTIQARFQLKTKSKKNENTQKVITDLVRRSVGEFSLDSAVFHDAAIHITLLTNDDSIKIELPAVTLKTDQIKVIPDSVYAIGDIEVDMKQTQIGLKNNLVLSLDKIFLGRDKKLVMKNLDLREGSGKRIVVIPAIEMTRMDLFAMISQKKIVAEALEVWNAQVSVVPELLKANHSKPVAGHEQTSSVDINRIVLHNASLIFDDEANSFRASKVDAVIHYIRTDSLHHVNFFVDRASVRDAILTFKEKKVTATLHQFSFGGRSISVKDLSLRQDKLTLVARNISAVHKDILANVKSIDQTRWDSIAVDDVDISGTRHLTPPASSKQAPRSSSLQFASGKIKVSALAIHVQAGDTTFRGSFSDLSITQVRHDEKQPFGFDLVNGFSNELHLQTGTMMASIAKLQFQWPNRIQAGRVEYAANGSKVMVDRFNVETIQKQPDRWLVSSVNTGAITLAKENVLDVTMDSLRVKRLAWKEKTPHIDFLELFHPQVSVLAKNKSKEKKEGVSLHSLPVDQFVVHPGRISLTHDKVIAFGEIRGDMPNKTFSVEFAEHKIPKSIIQVSNFLLKGDHAQIDSVMIKPNEQWYAENNIEDGKLRMKLSSINITSQSFDSMLYHQNFTAADLEVGNMDMVVTRDKRLPDPPEIEKPWSLSALIKLPPAVTLRSIHLLDGDIAIQETSDKTGQTGMITINDIRAAINLEKEREFTSVSMDAQARLYNQGLVQLKYTTLHPDTFKLAVRVNDFDLTLLNQIVLPSQSVEIESGFMHRYLAEIIASNNSAVGAAGIGYKKLHITIHRKGELAKKGLTTGLMTFIADGFVLKNSKKWALSEFALERIKHKSVFNYWVRLSARGAIEVILNGE